MSEYHYVYAEAYADGEWKCIDPYVKDFEGKYRLVPLYWTQSTFRDALRVSRIEGKELLINELSEEIKEELRYCKEDSIEIIAIDTATLYRLGDKNNFSHHGWIDEDVICNFENGLLEEIYIDEEEREYSSNKSYKLYEWDNYTDYTYHFKLIRNAYDILYGMWEDENYMHNIITTRIIIIKA